MRIQGGYETSVAVPVNFVGPSNSYAAHCTVLTFPCTSNLITSVSTFRSVGTS